MTEQLPVCVIGAGVSGLTTVKQLADRGVQFDCFEIGSDIGGNWRYDNDSGRSPAYASLHVDTSKDRFAYADLEMPREWPAYLHHSQVFEYLNMYAEKYGLKERISFCHQVLHAAPTKDGWSVTVRNLVSGDESLDDIRVSLFHPFHQVRNSDFDGVDVPGRNFLDRYPFFARDVVCNA